MVGKRNPVTTYSIKDLPEDKQEWLKNLKPPPVETKTNYSMMQKKGKKR